MKRFIFVLILCFFAVFALCAQEIDSDYVYKANKAGDQQFGLSLSLTAPIMPKQLKLGFNGTLNYKYLLSDNLMLGGSASFSYAGTVAKNIFYFVPITANITYQFVKDKVEIPVSFGLGSVVSNYADQKNFNIAIKPEIGILYRFSPDWSVGLNFAAYILPQIYFGEKSKYNYCALLLDFAAGVRYHF